jgi:hypothetical protein
MPAAMTFTSLLNDLKSYLERGGALDTTVESQLPVLINDAEREIAKDLKVQGFITNVTSSLVIGTSVYQKPDRWRKTISMEFGTKDIDTNPDNNVRNFIYPRDYEYCRMYWPDPTQTDIPQYYSDYDYYHWLVVPTPVAIYPWQINYYQLPPLLDDTNQTNWMTDIIPTTLRYRVLMEAAPFLKDDPRIQTWQGLYTQSVQGLTGQDMQKIVDRTTTRGSA